MKVNVKIEKCVQISKIKESESEKIEKCKLDFPAWPVEDEMGSNAVCNLI